MLKGIDIINIMIIGKKITIKYRLTGNMVHYFNSDSFNIDIEFNKSVVHCFKAKKIGKKISQSSYYFDNPKEFKEHCIKEGLKLLVKIGSSTREVSLEKINKDIIYTNMVKRAVESKKCSRIANSVSRLIAGKQEPNHSVKSKKTFNRNLEYVKLYEQEDVDNKVILYESYHGKMMGCNPYAIFKHLLSNEEYKGYKHVWAMKDVNDCKDKYKNVDNIELVEINGPEYIRYLAKAKYLINNTTFPPYYIRKEEQVYLNTWHGTPLKTLGKLVVGDRGPHKNIQRNMFQATHLIHPNKFTADVLSEVNDINGIYGGKLFDSGYPRIDLIFNSDKEEIRGMLNLKDDKKVILYAPTWRGEIGDISNEIERFIEDYEYLVDSVGSEYTVLIRVHYFMVKSLIDKGYGDYIVDNRIDTNELLSVTDVLISDYSSIIVDFMATKKPIFIYCYDRDKYTNERGFILELEDMPGNICYTMDELVLQLMNVDSNIHENENKYKIAYEKYNYNDDGNATKRVVDFIFGDEVDGAYEMCKNKKNILIYCGGFSSNGITTSALNLLDSVDYDKYNVIVVDKDKYDKESESNISQVNKNVKLIYRVGYMLRLEDEKVQEELLFADGLKGEIMNEKAVLSLYKRENKRLFGNISFDIAIDFSGYSKFWALILATSDIDKKIIYQHSDMIKEYDKVVNGKLKHQQNMNVIFPLYNEFDKVVSVAKHTMNVNSESLKPWVPDAESKFSYINNSINYEKVLKMCDENNKVKIDNNYYQVKHRKVGHDGNLSLDVFPQVDTSKNNFFTIGRMSPEKDQKKLIQSFSRVVKEYPHSMLYIMGDGALRRELEDSILDLGLQANIILTGQVENPFEIAKDCDCFVLSSNHEGQPMVLLEMLIIDKDIIATDIPGNRSVLEDGYGILCDNDEESLSQAMLDYIKNKDKYEFKKFNYEEYNKKALDMFYDIIED